ncbi:MAG: hypothetical protein KIT11_10485 [Fimbriimonadaceae bacterium]|nr:hypothetical protein [Fimbriimonadaceae bacterium]QYK55748.1 MAG: hypothetical protein KF733_12155 [Fimbriimonadaceae bacterium]
MRRSMYLYVTGSFDDECLGYTTGGRYTEENKSRLVWQGQVGKYGLWIDAETGEPLSMIAVKSTSATVPHASTNTAAGEPVATEKAQEAPARLDKHKSRPIPRVNTRSAQPPTR